MDANTLLFDRYEVERLLGEGAQSQVFLVRDLHNQGVHKAAKVLHPSAGSAGSLASLVKEFHLLESIDHQNLVRVYECRFLPQGKSPVVLTEYVEGAVSLDDLLKGTKEIPFAARLRIAFQILNAVAFLHQKKIIHGDLKPGNILVVQKENPIGKNELDFSVKLIDFGVSQDLFEASAKKRAGTPYYIAPEVLREGLRLSSDLYSLGVIFYRLLVSNTLPYQGMAVQEIIDAHLQNRRIFDVKIIENAPLHPFLIRLCQTLIEPDPLDRPRNLDEVLRQFKINFVNELSNLSVGSNEARVRQHLGVASELKFVMQFLQACVSQELQPANEPMSLFISGAAGQGKTRFLQEIGRACEKDRRSIFRMTFSPKDFFADLIFGVIQEFLGTKTVAQYKEVLLAQMERTESPERMGLFASFLAALAEEVSGLIVLVDGLGDKVPEYFLRGFRDFTLKIVVRRSQGKRIPLAFIFTVGLKPTLPSEVNEISETSQRISNLVKQIDSSFDLDQNSNLRQRNSATDFLKPNPRLSEDIALLSRERTILLLDLPSWGVTEVVAYLKESIPNLVPSENFVHRLIVGTRGIPGVVHAFINEFLNGRGNKKEINEHEILFSFEQFFRNQTGYDVTVHRLKYYDEDEMKVLALVAALGITKIDDLLRILSGFESRDWKPIVLRTIMKCYDDQIFHKSKSNEYFISSQNVVSWFHRKSISREDKLNGFFRDLNNQSSFRNEERLNLFLFLGYLSNSVDLLVDMYEKSRNSRERLGLGMAIENLDQQISKDGIPSDLEIQKAYLLKFYAIENYVLRKDLKRASEVCLKFLSLTERSNSKDLLILRAKTLVVLGTILRVTRGKESAAIQHLNAAIASGLLDRESHEYALANRIVCELYIALAENRNDQVVDDLLVQVEKSRKNLETLNKVRFGLVTSLMGGFFMDQQKFQKAISYYRMAADCYVAEGEDSRLLTALREMGRAHFRIGDYQKAIDIFDHAFLSAEASGHFISCAESLVSLVQCYYMTGEVRKFSMTCGKLGDLSERIQDKKYLDLVFEHTANCYLESGEIGKAVDLVNAQREYLAANQNKDALLEIRCRLLMASIYQRTENWSNAEESFEEAKQFLSTPVQKSNPIRKALQVLQFLEVNSVCHLDGPGAALNSLNQKIDEGAFDEYVLDEAILKCHAWAVMVGDLTRATSLRERIETIIEKFSYFQKVLFWVNCSRDFFGRHDVGVAEAYLKKADAILETVLFPLPRAQYFTQRARLLGSLGRKMEAKQAWQAAEAEFVQFTRTWDEADRQRFFDLSPDVKEHRALEALLGKN